MTSQQAANLNSAKILAAGKFGVASSQTKDLPYELREPYREELARIILLYPERFDELTVANARREQTLPPDATLETYTLFDATEEFADEFANQAVELGGAVASVGEGVKNTLSLTKWVLPVVALVGVVILLIAFSRRTGATKTPAPAQ